MTAPMTLERLAEHEEVLLYASWPMGEEQHDAVVEAACEALAEVKRLRKVEAELETVLERIDENRASAGKIATRGGMSTEGREAAGRAWAYRRCLSWLRNISEAGQP